MTPNFRELIEIYEKSGRLQHVKRQVDSRFEAAAVMKKTKGAMPMLFERIDGFAAPVVCGLGGTRAHIAESIGAAAEDLPTLLAQAIRDPIAVTRVKTAPVQENVIEAPFDFTQYFPVFTHNALDGGAFFVSGIMVCKDESGAKLYTSIRRMQYLGGNKATVLITSLEMKEQFRRYGERRQPLEIAVMFGVTPAVVLTSQISTHSYDVNKLDVAGALMRRSLSVVRCKTVDVDVLADAEIVLEGTVRSWDRVPEGPFGELAGYYGAVSDQPVVEFTAMTHRNQPIVQTLFPSGYEERLPMSINREVVLMETLRQSAPCVRQVHVTPGGIGRLHVIVQITKENVSDGRQAALAAFAADKDIKHVVVVDADIDPFDPADVELALATRMQADRDIFIISGCAGSPLEPSHLLCEATAKMGVDATKPIGDERFRRTHIPSEEKIRLEDYIS